MKRFKKIILLVVALLLTVAISITATIAYLKSQTEVVQNTFTVGKVSISLDEAKVNEDGKPVDEDGNVVDVADAPRVYENEYKLIPGRTYVKDPTVHVAADSQPCVLFAVLYIPPELRKVLYYSTSDHDTKYIEGQMRKHGWLPDPDYDDPAGEEGEASYDVFVYNHAQAAYPGDVIHIFDSITVKDTATYEQLQEVDLSEIRITVYGFQNEGTEQTDARVLWDIIVEAFAPFGNNP